MNGASRWCVCAILALSCADASSQGFPDQGFSGGTPVIRTDFASSNEGTAANPLTLGPICLYAPCRTGPVAYGQSNYWSQNLPANCYVIGCQYWILGMNNEDAWTTLNPGPPNASLPRAAPGSGIMGFTTLYGNDNFPGDTLWRAHLVLNISSSFANPAPGATPFLSLGAWTGHGTNGPIGVLNPSTSNALSILSFGERLWDFQPPTRRYASQDATLASYVYITAKWGSAPRMVAVMLFHDNIKNSTAATLAHLKWNWNIQESSYYPGAEIVFIDAEDVQAHCGFSIPRLTTKGQEINYRIDPTALFACVRNQFSEPFPTTANIPITAVFWASEATGKDGGVWVDIHKMKMLKASESAFATGESAASGTVAFGYTTREIGASFESLRKASVQP